MRTFISPSKTRKKRIKELYEVIVGIVRPEDTLVVVDDSIVRGVTLRDSLIPKLIELNPKKIIIVSSAPPVLYPDCYGIDMSQLGQFVGFQAALSLLKERGEESILDAIRTRYLSGSNHNEMQVLYQLFSLEELSERIATLVAPSEWEGRVQVIYQTLWGLQKAMPDFAGDWYFSGNYPTPGGYKVLSQSFLNWASGDDESRSY